VASEESHAHSPKPNAARTLLLQATSGAPWSHSMRHVASTAEQLASTVHTCMYACALEGACASSIL